MTPKKRRGSSKIRAKGKTRRTKSLHTAKLSEGHLVKVLGMIRRENSIAFIAFIAVALIVIIGPLKRGLFYEADYILLLVISFGLFILWWINRLMRGDITLLKTPLDLFVLLFLIGYFLSLLTALHLRPAIGEFLKVASYASFYFNISHLCRQHDLFSFLFFYKKTAASNSGQKVLFYQPATVLLLIAAISGYTIAVGGLLNAAGIMSIPQAYLDGRITTPIGYANTGAAYLMSTCFIAVGFGLLFERWYLRPLFVAPIVLSVITIFLTYSRGVWFIFPFFIILFCFISVPGKRMLVGCYCLSATAISFPFVFLLNKSFNETNSLQAFVLILLALSAMIISGYLAEFLVRLSLKVKIAFGIILILIILSGFLYLAFLPLDQHLLLTLPEDIYTNIYSRVASVDLRLAHTNDALKIVRDYPLFGVGGGGWKALYQSYQEIPYISKFVHNHFMEVWLDSGLLGFISFIAIWVTFILVYFRHRFKQTGIAGLKQLWTSVFMAVIALGTHSAFDWNLSYTAVSIYLFMLFAICNSYDTACYKSFTMFLERYFIRFRTPSVVLVSFTSIFLFIYTIFLYVGFNATARAQEMLATNNLKDAEIELNKAIHFDPYRAENYHNMAILIELKSRGLGGIVYQPEYHDLVVRAYELEPYNTLYLGRYAALLLGTGNYDEGLTMLRQMINLRPLHPEQYQKYAFMLTSSIDHAENAYPDDSKKKYLHAILELEQVAIHNTGSSEQLYYFIGKAHYLLGNHREALKYLSMVQPGDQFFMEAAHLAGAID